MHVTEVTDVKDDAQPRHRVPVLWPWVLVIAAWTTAGLSVFTNQSYLINHHYLGHWRDHLRGRGSVPVQPA